MQRRNQLVKFQSISLLKGDLLNKLQWKDPNIRNKLLFLLILNQKPLKSIHNHSISINNNLPILKPTKTNQEINIMKVKVNRNHTPNNPSPNLMLNNLELIWIKLKAIFRIKLRQKKILDLSRRKSLMFCLMTILSKLINLFNGKS